MNNLITFVFSIALTLFCTATVASKHCKGEPGHLILFQSEYAEVNDLGNGNYDLVLKKEFLNRVVMFTGRYFSISKNIKENEIKTRFKPGEGKIQVVGLKAAIDVGEEAQRVTISKVKVTDKSIHFLHSASNWPDYKLDGEGTLILYVEKGSNVKGNALWCAVTLTC